MARSLLAVATLMIATLTWTLVSCHVEDSSPVTVKPPQNEDIVCFVIRTYWGHGDTWGDKSLRKIVGSLQNQTDGRWEAMLLVMDNRPFPELRRIVRELNDSRVWVHAEWINYKYNPKEGGQWAKNYHNKLYNLTDLAIRACPERSRWVVVTNGDNTYDRKFVETVFSSPPDTDVVAIDFYSRYQRPTATPCERFEEGPGLPPCKENGMRFCQTDLAANAYRLDRLVAEDRRFGVVDPSGTHGANDGVMAQILKSAGWKIHYVHGHCLVNHAPSPQQCALLGGIWDDSVMNLPSSFGGSCVAVKTVAERMRANPNLYELLELNVTFDRESFSYASHQFVQLRCLRLADRAGWHQLQTFGRVCAARVDVPSLPASLPSHPWDGWVETPERGEKTGVAAVEQEGSESTPEGAEGSEEAAVWAPSDEASDESRSPEATEHSEL